MAWYNDIGWWTGATQAREAADAQNEIKRAAGASAVAGADTLAKAQESGFAAQLPWLLKAIEQLQTEYAGRQGMLQTGLQGGLAELTKGEADIRAAAAAQDAAKMGNVREGMNLDRTTLTDFMNRVLAAQQPQQTAYERMIQTSLNPLLGALSGQSQLPISGYAQTQLADTNRQIQAAMQKQGLGGSSMATAQTVAGRNRVIGADQENQRNLLQQMLTAGLSGAGLQGQTLTAFGQKLGGLGERLGQVSPTDLTSLLAGIGRDRAGVHQRNTELAQSAKSGLPEAFGSMGDFYNRQIVNPATTRAGGQAVNIQQIGSQVVPQSQGGIGTLTDLAKLYGTVTTGFGGGSGGSISSTLGKTFLPGYPSAW